MELRGLVGAPEAPMLTEADNADIANIRSDSRRVTKGSLFVAMRGTAMDSHAYMDSATEEGTVTIACEEALSYLEGRCLFTVVKDSAETLGLLVFHWYDDPPGKLVLAGATGTNGKTTVATLLHEVFREMGYKVGPLSMICSYIGGEAAPTDYTTSDPLTLHSLMARMVEARCEYAFAEVGSHSIDQRRISGLSFNGGIFTNLTHDHLDYHKTVENYLKVKKRFSDDLPAGTPALTNADDKSGLVMLQNTEAEKLTYSLHTLANFKGKILESHFKGMDLITNGREVAVHLVGRFNAYNLLAVYGAAVPLEKDPGGVSIMLSALRSVSGHFETIQFPLGYTAIADYAHTLDTLTNILSGIHEILNGKGRTIAIVGTGGNRNRRKHPPMAKEAVRPGDWVVLASDNPCLEGPDDITNDTITGPTEAGMEHALCITDRMQTIKTATILTKKGDVILVAGKSHEDYQEIKGAKHHFNNRKKLREIFSTQQS